MKTNQIDGPRWSAARAHMDELALGLRVVRGPDWNWGKQDGGERHVGTVTHWESSKEVVVVWDSGTMANYRCSNPYDLRVLDSASAGVRHNGVVCNGCSATPILGTRWQCGSCASVDLCSSCYHDDKHDPRHHFYRVPVPGGPRIKIGQPRSKGKKDMCKGIFPGAKVVRGGHWQWDNQDGGEGKRGRVIQIQDWDHNYPGSGVLVEWENGYRNLYRLTFRGKVDVKVVKEAKGRVYYFEHLPLLGETKVPRRGSVAVGDYVRVGMQLDAFRRNQTGHGGWCEAMLECMMNVGRVVAIDHDGDAVVAYSNRKKWTLNPVVLSKVFVEQSTPDEEVSPHGLNVGDFVKIASDVRKVKALQKGHGEWVEAMSQTLGRVGQIVSVFPDGDVKLKLPGQERHWTFNPESVTKVEPDGAPLTPVTTGHVSEMLRTVFDSHVPASPAEALVMAAANGNVAALSDLLHSSRGDCGVNDKSNGQTALHAACKNGHLDAVKCLLAEGAQLEVEDSSGDFPIHHAALGGEPEVVELLAQEGADLNVRNHRQQTPLHVATVKGHLSVMRALLTNHCHASLQDSTGDTPLHDAITKKREDIVRLLTEHHANPALPNKNGFNAIHLVALKGNSGALRIILSKLPVTCSLDDAKDDGFTALHLAALNNHRAVAELLLESGASRDPRNLHKATPLHLAVERQNVELVRLLVDSGANVNVQDKDGRTPLHEAIQCHVMTQLKTLTGSSSDLSTVGLSNSFEKKSSFSIASFLVSRRADPSIKNNSGYTALELCSDPNLNRILLKTHQENQQISLVAASASPQCSPSLSSAPSPTNECAVCSDTSSDTAFLPCGHIVMCWSCAERVKRCIVCKEAVETKQKVEECMVCSEKPGDVIFHPCGHIVTCQECSKKVRKCLSCRAVVEDKQFAVRALPSRIASAGSLGEDQTQNLMKEVEALKEQLLCSICCDRKKNCVLNCGHTYCQMCADQMKACPICKKTIVKRIIMYDS